MLSDEQNRRLTQVGAGTPMGELLRLLDAHRRRGRVGRQGDEARAPAGRGSRPLSGPGRHLWSPRPALRASPRRPILWMGRGLRAALPLPRLGVGSHRQVPAAAFEEVANPEARFKDRVRIKAYPVEAKAGLLWAYLGPPPVPLVPTWEPFTWRNGLCRSSSRKSPTGSSARELDRPCALRVAAQPLDACLAG